MKDVARSRLATLLGNLLLDGFTDEALSVVSALPALAEVVPDRSEDERAVRHEALWGRWVSPYASAFLSADGALGGAVAARVDAAYRGAGFFPTRTDVEADHLGMLCRFVGGLYALGDAAPREAIERQVLRPVLGALLPAVRDAGFEEWTRVIDLLHGLVGEGDTAPLPAGPPLDDGDLGWRRLAVRWTVPVAVGGWLTPGHLDLLADAAGVPRGFGTRRSRVEKIVLSALDQGRLPAVLDALVGIVETWAAGPAPWSDRARAARAALGSMREAIDGSSAAR